MIFAGTVFRQGLTTDWTLFNSSAPNPIVLPDLTLLRSQPDGSALISWRDGSTNKLGALTADGAVTNLFDLVPSTGEIFSAEPLTDAVRDAAGRLVIAAVFEKPSPEGTGYATINYPVARFDPAGHLDPTFSLLAVPRFLKSGAVRTAADGSMLVTYEELGGAPRLRRLLPNGLPDSRFELGLAKTLAELDHGPVRAADLDHDGHVLIVLRKQPLDELLLVRLDADGRPTANAVIPGSMGEVASVTNQADGSVLVIMGNKKVGPTEFTWPWYPTLLRFHPDLHPDEAFNSNVAALGREFGELSILESRPDGGVVVCLNHSQRGSCVFYLGPEGSVEKRIPF